VQAALDEVMKGRTTFVIAHRLSTVRNATRVLVFDAGRVVESGSFDELALRDGRFAQLARAQFMLLEKPAAETKPAVSETTPAPDSKPDAMIAPDTVNASIAEIARPTDADQPQGDAAGALSTASTAALDAAAPIARKPKKKARPPRAGVIKPQQTEPVGSEPPSGQEK
jgi:ABC-type multidrug transport system ATPase subunit